MGEFILNVEIDDIMMPYLKQTGNMYNLCVAKKVGTDYNVVWVCFFNSSARDAISQVRSRAETPNIWQKISSSSKNSTRSLAETNSGYVLVLRIYYCCA